jgi:hypothetical protein
MDTKSHPQKKKHISTEAVIALSAGVAAAGAITYYFFGPNSKDHQKKLKGWMIKMKGEIIQKIEMSGKITEAAYNDIVDTVASAYKDTVTPEELAKFINLLKKHWKSIQHEAMGKKSPKKAAKKVAKK